MATAKKLPSGSWRCRVYDYTDENGKNTINHSRLTIQSPQERERLRLPPLLMQFQKKLLLRVP